MNLAKVEGSFDCLIDLIKSIIKEYLKFDYNIQSESSDQLCFDSFALTLAHSRDISPSIFGISVTSNGRNEMKLFDSSKFINIKFPVTLKGNLKDLVNKEALSSFLLTIKTELISGDKKSNTEPSSSQGQMPKAAEPSQSNYSVQRDLTKSSIQSKERLENESPSEVRDEG